MDTISFPISSFIAILGSLLLASGAALWTDIIMKTKSIDPVLGIEVSMGLGIYMTWAAFACLVFSIYPYWKSTRAELEEPNLADALVSCPNQGEALLATHTIKCVLAKVAKISEKNHRQIEIFAIGGAVNTLLLRSRETTSDVGFFSRTKKSSLRNLIYHQSC
jgi:hypothetical protein